MKSHLILHFSLITCSLFFEIFGLQQRHFAKDVENIDRIPSSGLRIYHQRNSISQCLQMCGLQAQCQMAYFRQNDAECLLYDFPVFQFTQTVTDVGFRPYRILNDCAAVGYVYHRASKICVRIFYLSTRITSDDAEQNCTKTGATLMSVNTVQKLDFLDKLLREADTGSFHLLVGLKFQDGVWKWKNGTGFQSSLFSSLLLNNYDSHMPVCPAGHCGIIRKGNSNGPLDLWDFCCDRIENSYICEKEVV